MRRCSRWAAGVAVLLLAALPRAGSSQEPQVLRITGPDGASGEFPVSLRSGVPSVQASVLAQLGWRVAPAPGGIVATLPDGMRLELRIGTPFVRLDATGAQLVGAPVSVNGALLIPLQLVTDLLPDRLPELYRSVGSHEVRILEDGLWEGGDPEGLPEAAASQGGSVLRQPLDPRDEDRRVVIIDPGHGGVDPGSLGGRRTREKDVTLAIGLALARALEGDPDIEVHLTRDDDTLVPLWERGEIATRLKGDRYGIFLSIHANAVNRREVRGVETYFLSEARTEHEARVAALENSAADLERGRARGPTQGEMDFIISDLLNNDFQHWSSNLAEGLLQELVGVYSGPNRGLKQGPLAVLTNAMMPSALIEVGFITNPQDERLLRDPDYHGEVAEALAQAVREFFQGYPPGSGQSRDRR